MLKKIVSKILTWRDLKLTNSIIKPILNLSKEYHSVVQDHDFEKMKIKVLPALKDNYMYLLIDKESKEAAAIDPVDAGFMFENAEKESVQIEKILTTHHHWDHASGNERLLKLLDKPIEVFGGDSRIAALTKRVSDSDLISVGNLKLEVMHTPCHTTGHVCYLLKSGNENIIFSGDCIFQGGCGRFFEGTADQAYCCLCEKLSKLPDNTKIFCGHESTVPNLKFAHELEPLNEAIKDRLSWAESRRSKREPTIPSTIGQEKQWNPFMRVKEPAIRQVVGPTDPIAIMDRLRLQRNNFKSK